LVIWQFKIGGLVWPRDGFGQLGHRVGPNGWGTGGLGFIGTQLGGATKGGGRGGG